ncbi:MAG: ABC transporter permease subunit [Bacillaceae bacterium]|nr:ABC transporter permease subunit [Bacillaceae bacterium]
MNAQVEHETKTTRRRPGFIAFSFLLAVTLIAASWIYILFVEEASLFALFSEKNLEHTREFLFSMMGIGVEEPAFFSKESWMNALRLTYETLVMSILAIGFSVIGMVLTVIPASANYADGTLMLAKKWYSRLVYGVIRILYVFSRAVPELIWAMLIIFIFKPGILPGAVALALHNFGILGKLCAEVIEDLDMRPIRSLASSGAGKTQILIYGIIPMVMPKFITYILYRWEVIIRTTIVVGFVGAGGLGQQFKLSMSWFHYTEVTLLLISYFILVVLSDFISEMLRKAVQ